VAVSDLFVDAPEWILVGAGGITGGPEIPTIEAREDDLEVMPPMLDLLPTTLLRPDADPPSSRIDSERDGTRERGREGGEMLFLKNKTVFKFSIEGISFQLSHLCVKLNDLHSNLRIIFHDSRNLTLYQITQVFAFTNL
jgi:hypothetical protein